MGAQEVLLEGVFGESPRWHCQAASTAFRGADDGFGSLRWPTQCCGIGSLRLTLGRIPHGTTAGMIDMPIGGQHAERPEERSRWLR